MKKHPAIPNEVLQKLNADQLLWASKALLPYTNKWVQKKGSNPFLSDESDIAYINLLSMDELISEFKININEVNSTRKMGRVVVRVVNLRTEVENLLADHPVLLAEAKDGLKFIPKNQCELLKLEIILLQAMKVGIKTITGRNEVENIGILAKKPNTDKARNRHISVWTKKWCLDVTPFVFQDKPMLKKCYVLQEQLLFSLLKKPLTFERLVNGRSLATARPKSLLETKQLIWDIYSYLYIEQLADELLPKWVIDFNLAATNKTMTNEEVFGPRPEESNEGFPLPKKALTETEAEKLKAALLS